MTAKYNSIEILEISVPMNLMEQQSFLANVEES